MSTTAYHCQSTNPSRFADHEHAGPRVTRDDAPFPAEHFETERNPVPFHRLWIPATSATPYLNAERALNLRSRQR